MKKIFILLIFILMISVVNAYQEELIENQLRVDLIRISPTPAQNGESFEAEFKITNYGDIDFKNIKVKATSNYPFDVVGDEEQIISVLNKDESINMFFRFKVNEQLSTGVYKINFAFDAKSLAKIYTVSFDVNVVGVDEIVSLDSVSTEPDKIIPGKEAKLKFSVSNKGNYQMDDITVKLDFSSAPITPLYSTNERKINHINSGESIDLIFDIIADSDAVSKAYKVPVDITYYDRFGNKMNRNNTLGILIDYPPEYVLNIDETKVFQSGKSGDVIVSISNVGPSEMKYVSMQMGEGTNYEVVNSNTVYVGNLDSDEFETAKFKIFIKKTKDKEIPLNILINYKDAYNNEFNKLETLNLNLYGYSESVAYGLSQPSSGPSVLVFIIIIVLVYYVIRVWRKEKNLPKATKIVFSNIFVGFFKLISFPFRKRKRRR